MLEQDPTQTIKTYKTYVMEETIKLSNQIKELVTFCRSDMKVQPPWGAVPRSPINVSRNQIQLSFNSASTIANATGYMLLFASPATAIRSYPLNLPFKKQPSKQIRGLQPILKPVLIALKDTYNRWKNGGSSGVIRSVITIKQEPRLVSRTVA